MTFTATALADGQVAATATTVYTCPSSTVAYIKSLTLFNSNAASQAVVLRLNRSGTARLWKRYVLDQYESANVLEHGESMILEAGDTITAESTNASAVDYTISGVLET